MTINNNKKQLKIEQIREKQDRRHLVCFCLRRDHYFGTLSRRKMEEEIIHQIP